MCLAWSEGLSAFDGLKPICALALKIAMSVMLLTGAPEKLAQEAVDALLDNGIQGQPMINHGHKSHFRM